MQLSRFYQVFNSWKVNVFLDACGVCGGDGSTCKMEQGSFNSTSYGYNTVLQIPAGATNIDIRQQSFDNTPRDDNYLGMFAICNQ